MFGLSLPKLVVLAAIVYAVWYIFKLIGRRQELREAQARRRSNGARRESASSDAAAGQEIEDMVKCRVCGAYVPARGAASCGQSGCPYTV